MYYVDSQRTLTRRGSSLVTTRGISEGYDTGRSRSTARLQSESTASLANRPPRPNGSVKKELVTMMFESMLDSIVDSWDIIPPPAKPEEGFPAFYEPPKSPSEQTVTSKRPKKKDPGPPPTSKNSRTKRTRSSKLELLEQVGPVFQCWWSSPDERAIIRFKNGNKYEGNISMKCMHGEGRFQWADGTVYLGQFNDNKIQGKGLIRWKDDTWYEGDFVGNLRHGQGLYVDSRNRASYTGGWYCGAKHGKGRITYSSLLDTNTYDGDWVYNVRHGFGLREYTTQSGYKGEWDRYIREGKGLMIWPNHDFYRGGWQNGVMSGYGMYIWNAYYNNTMSLPSIGAYRGNWYKGERNGYGLLNLGLGLGSHYRGEFMNNNKHGPGKFVTNNGLILRNNKMLFIDDILGTVTSNPDDDSPPENEQQQQHQIEPFHFNICDDTVGLMYHIERAYQNMDNEMEIRTNMIDDYIMNNKIRELKSDTTGKEIIVAEDSHRTEDSHFHLEDVLEFEDFSLRKALRNYETDFKNIYLKYATICNTEEISFPPVMIRLYLWQFYNDCNVHEKGLYLVEIDRIFHECPDMLSRSAHDPFEKIYFWQFLHSMIAVASRLYAKRQLPGVRPDTILTDAFRTFVENDVLPGCGRRKGLLTNGYGVFVPLNGAYQLYRSLGEPHTVRTFLCATRRPPHYIEPPQPALVEPPDDATPIGWNAYIFGDEMTFLTNEPMSPQHEEASNDDELQIALKLFNFGNLSSKSIIKIFSKIFPHLYVNGKIMDLDVELTFYEFFEAFVACALKSIRVKEEELRWKDKFTFSNDTMPNPPSPSPAVTVKGIKYL